jgi:hypothetical protein
MNSNTETLETKPTFGKPVLSNSTKQQRVDIVNQIIKEIAARGRRFFHNKGQTAELFLKNNKVYYKCEWTSMQKQPVTQICLSIPTYRVPKGWFHGGTLKALCFDFRDFINTGKPSNHNHGYSGLYCPHWGYKATDMLEIQEKAKELGYL